MTCLHVKVILSSHVGLLFARAYAISSHNKLVFVILALLGITAITLWIIAIANNDCISTSNIFIFDIHSSNAGVRCSTSFSETEFMIHVSVETLNGVFTILFDTVVFVSIIENTLGLLQLQSGIPELQRNSLSKLLIQQDMGNTHEVLPRIEISNFDRFVLTITLADAITKKALKPSLQGILNTVQNSFVFLSTIIICRFHLDLKQRNDHPNGSNTSHSLPLGSFHAVTERIHRAVVDEFGDLSFNESFGTEGEQEDIELQDMQFPSGAAEIDLQEFPWAGGDIGDEEAGPVASGSGILRE
ncbi:hypothetical protein K439DRAFT_1624441 [Ramaria rubella]|nr:hypothetical protein K439DRAFT_1624441 [Ramaria rubella]